MQKHTEFFRQASSLRADILAAPEVWLPRREILLEWLNGFVQRSGKSGYDLGESEAADLTALDAYLRVQNVPIA